MVSCSFLQCGVSYYGKHIDRPGTVSVILPQNSECPESGYDETRVTKNDERSRRDIGGHYSCYMGGTRTKFQLTKC